jgi:hypothetical protein
LLTGADVGHSCHSIGLFESSRVSPLRHARTHYVTTRTEALRSASGCSAVDTCRRCSQAQEWPCRAKLTIGDDLKGDLKSTTTLNHFNVIITAETDSQTKTPSDEVVLTATVQE